MKKLLPILITLCLLLPVLAAAETVAASFYPVYALTVNLLEGLEDQVELVCLASPSTGCLHDYQLSTGEMKALSRADAFIVCGAGMESYLTMVYEAFPSLPVIEASAGIMLIDEEGGTVDPASVAPDEEVNAHVWLDVSNAMTMVNNIADGLCKQLPQYAEKITANRDSYLARLTLLDQEMKDGLAGLSRRDIVTFHEAFPYFAKAYGLNVAAVVTLEPGDSLSPTALAKLINTVSKLSNPPLFTEPQYDDMAARTVSAETGAPIYELDPIVTGTRDLPAALTAYEDAMRSNLAVLQTALK